MEVMDAERSLAQLETGDQCQQAKGFKYATLGMRDKAAASVVIQFTQGEVMALTICPSADCSR